MAGDVDESLVGNIDSADAGIFLCCVISIVCRTKILTSGYMHNDSACVRTSLDTDRYCHNNNNNGRREKNFPEMSLVCGDESYVSSCEDISISMKEAGEENGSQDPIVRLLSLPLTQRILVCVHWLSVISNCLTYFLRASQVLYAFLLCSCDMVLSVISDDFHGNNNNDNNNKSISHRLSTNDSTSKSFPACMREENVDSSSMRKKRSSTTYYQKEKNSHNSPSTGVDYSSYVKCEVIPNTSECNSGKRRALDMRRCVHVISPQGVFLVVLNMLLLFSLVIFHVHHLFFWVGALAGYIAACGILFILGSEIGVLLYVLEWMHPKNSLHRYSPQEVVVGVVGVSPSLIPQSVLDVCRVSFPPLIVLVNKRLGVLYTMELMFSFACSTFYFAMLREEGEALFSTHVEFMRWYVGTVATGLVDIVRLVLFVCLLRLINGPEGRSWRYFLYSDKGGGGGGLMDTA